MPTNGKIRLTNPLPISNILTVRTKFFALILIAAFVYAVSPIAFSSGGAHGRNGHALTTLDVCGAANGATINPGGAAPFVCEARFSMDLPLLLSHVVRNTRAYIPIVTPDVNVRPPLV